jgi:hypothetical protein
MNILNLNNIHIILYHQITDLHTIIQNEIAAL